jgi:hypothetical protein
MVIGETQKIRLIALEDLRKKQAINEEQNRKKQTLNVKCAFIISNFYQAPIQAAHDDLSKKCKLLFAKKRKMKLKKRVSYKVEKTMHFNADQEKPEKSCLFYFNYFFPKLNTALKESEPMANFPKKKKPKAILGNI